MKLTPNIALHKELFDARLNLWIHLMSENKSQLKRSKITHYHLMNKPSKLMARRVAMVKHKTKIPFLTAQSRGCKLFNPLDIANEFSDFYHKLYNLREDPSVGVPTAQEIDTFLSFSHLPSLSESQVLEMNSPFTEL